MAEIFLDPVAKPRMTRRDVWKRRPVVLKYRKYCDDLRDKFPFKELNDSYKVVFHVKMPKSWTKKKKKELVGKPHQQRPDLDNFVKAFNDALKEEDSTVYKTNASKYWATDGYIQITQ